MIFAIAYHLLHAVEEEAQIWSNLVAASFEYCILTGVEFITFAADLDLFQGWASVGAGLEPLGEPITMDGETYIAAKEYWNNVRPQSRRSSLNSRVLRKA